MPFINTKVNVTITKEKEKSIKEKYGKAIECIPGKTESWLMCAFEQDVPMYFRGESEANMAFLEVKIFGKAQKPAFDAMTKELTEILAEELGILPDHTYIKYEEVDIWGYNGRNF